MKMVGRGRGRGNINSNNYAKSYTTKRLPLLAEYDDSQMSDDMEMENLGNQDCLKSTKISDCSYLGIAFSNPSQARQRGKAELLLLLHVKQKKEEYFIISDEDDRLNNFCIATMQRIYKTWKNKLHGIYKSYKTDNERLRNRPDDVEEQYWNHCVKHFGSEKFKKISAQNSNNAKKRKQKHTTGNVSFAETEERMVDPITNEKPSLPIIWLRQHTRKTQEGGIEWADEYSKKIGEQLEQLVDQNSIEGEIPMTNEELYDQVMGVRSGYRRGFGYGKKGFRKNACQNEKQQQRILELEQQLQELQDQFDNEHEQQKQREKEFETKIRDQVLKEMQDILKQNPLNFSNYTAPVLDDTLLEEE
ncbi:uncharacterized protein LOC126662225 [Mercurialis annua]|uniref:uncharacterized protein LOC126662225 n=1 Tax=Mercurialis annua TaxID=3986 RepID=UPI0024AE9D9C|nr:uncharacterized protein LOC126662225 [Mercurialis annua]